MKRAREDSDTSTVSSVSSHDETWDALELGSQDSHSLADVYDASGGTFDVGRVQTRVRYSALCLGPKYLGLWSATKDEVVSCLISVGLDVWTAAATWSESDGEAGAWRVAPPVLLQVAQLVGKPAFTFQACKTLHSMYVGGCCGCQGQWEGDA